MTEPVVPERIHRSDREITIAWDGTHLSTYPARMLRLACPCATCRDEFTGRELLHPDSVPEDIGPAQVSLVGNYAIKILWSDGHDTGIYTYEYLLSLCACERCERQKRQ